MMKFNIIVLMFSLLFIPLTRASDNPLVGAYYLTTEEESLEGILKSFNIDQKLIAPESRLIKIIKSLNPEIEDFNAIAKNEVVYLKFPQSYLDKRIPLGKRMISFDLKTEEEFDTVKKNYFVASPLTPKDELVKMRKLIRSRNIAKKNKKSPVKYVEVVKAEPVKKLTMSAHYQLLTSSFSEEVASNGFTSDSTRNSPAVVGISLTSDLLTKWLGPTHELQAGFFLTHYAEISTTNEAISLPMDMNLYGYDQFPVFNNMFNFYAGIELDKFTTLNIEDIANALPSTTYAQTIFFLTVGASKKTQLWGSDFTFKGSLSQALISMSETPPISGAAGDAYSGQMLHLLGDYVFDGDFSIRLFTKNYFLSGPTELSIFKIGIGLNYKFY